MTVDMRREHARIQRELRRHVDVAGETVLWFKFDPKSSRYHDVYDEGGKGYLPAVPVPVLWIDQVEDPEQYSDRGRRPTQRLRLAVAATALGEAGISPAEAHGGRTWDPPVPAPDPDQVGRPEAPWSDDRLNDLLYYDGRYWGVSSFQIRGRAQRDDTVVGVTAIEKQVKDEPEFDIYDLPSLFPPDWSES